MKPRKHQCRNIGGYLWDRQMTQALDGNDQARDTLAAIHDHIRAVNCANQVNLLLISQLLTDAILSLDHSKSALIELRTIAEAQKHALAGGTATAGHLATGPARPAQPGEAPPGDASPHQDQDKDKETDE